jgi:uncharacterized protein involved in outer membrane biogenesis
MTVSPAMRRLGGRVLLAFSALAVLTVCLGVAIDAGFFRPLLLRLAAAQLQRDIRVDGALSVRLLSAHPYVTAQQVSIGNPSWAPAGQIAQIGELRIDLTPGWRGFHVTNLSASHATLTLSCDAQGDANWQARKLAPGQAGSLPRLASLQLSDARVTLDDERHHLTFDGEVSARDVPGDAQPLHIEGRGQLNGAAGDFVLTAQPPARADVNHPFEFTFTEHSSGAELIVHGSLPQPPDLGLLEARFESRGQDLKDLYQLTGLSLVHTGRYRLTGALSRRGTETRFDNLTVLSGESDLSAVLSVQSRGGRTHVDADLHARHLRLTDVGLRAAGRDPNAALPPHLFSDVKLNIDASRRIDAAVRFAADGVLMGRVPLQDVTATLRLTQGVYELPSLQGKVFGGRFETHARLDATDDNPPVTLTLNLKDLALARLAAQHGEGDGQGDGKGDRQGDAQGGGKRDAPLDGTLEARVDIAGRGRSLHEVAASAQGTFEARIPKGMVRDSLAELAGVDLRAFGLLIARSKHEVALNCAAASFVAQKGTLTAQRLIIDTEPVLIRGQGTVLLGSEQWDLMLRGEPKSLRILRVAAPITIRGALLHPNVALTTQDAAVKLFDRGAPRSVDCAAL